jgi:hypothetical protein
LVKAIQVNLSWYLYSSFIDVWDGEGNSSEPHSIFIHIYY